MSLCARMSAAGANIAWEQAHLFGQAKRTSREHVSSDPRGFAARSRVLARLVSLAQIGELARRLGPIRSMILWVNAYRNRWRRFWHLNCDPGFMKHKLIAHVVKPKWFLNTVWANFLVNNFRFFISRIVKEAKSNVFTCKLCAWVIFIILLSGLLCDNSNSLTYKPRNGQSPTLSRANCVTVYLMQTGFSQ